MSGDIQFGNDLDIPLGSILDDFGKLLLRIIIFADQFRMFFYFDSPSLVVCQMQLEYVVFVTCHLVNEELHIIYRKKMTGRVEHQCPMRKAGRIINVDRSNLFLCSGARVT